MRKLSVGSSMYRVPSEVVLLSVLGEVEATMRRAGK